jgi:hypothetical protein
MKCLVLFSLGVALILGIGLAQRQRLVALRGETALLRSNSAGSPIVPRTRSLERRSPGSEPPTAIRPSRAGEEKLPEMRQLIVDYIEAIRSMKLTPRQNFERMEELLAEMGALTFEELLTDLDKNVAPERELISWYISMNPPQALLFVKKFEDLPEREYRATSAFEGWGRLDPAAALQWLNQAEIDHDPLAAFDRLQERALALQMRINPGKALAKTLELTRSKPTPILPHNLYSELRGNPEHLALLAAMDQAETKPGDRALIARVRDNYVAGLRRSLARDTFANATELVDAGFTENEKLLFARLLPSLSQNVGLNEVDKWAHWLAKLNVPADNSHPLLEMLRANDDNAQWLIDLPQSELRTLAIASHARERRDPVDAATWVNRLPAGPKRTELGLQIAKRWAESDPEAAADFLEKEEAVK